MLASTSGWGDILSAGAPLLLFALIFFYLTRRSGLGRQREIMERNAVFMDRQEELLERIAVALEQRNTRR